MMNISYGMLGVMCYWLRGPFWAAVGIGYGSFLTMAFFGHMYEALVHGNYSMGNVGIQVWVDVLIAFVLFYLIFNNKKI